jgi:hypothetical protein
MLLFNLLGSGDFKWLRVAETALARRNIHGTFKQTGLRYSSRQLLSLRYGGVDVTRRIRVADLPDDPCCS